MKKLLKPFIVAAGTVSGLFCLKSCFGSSPLHCMPTSAEKAAEGLQKILEESPAPRTAAELEVILQDQAKITGKIPTFAAINSPLKAITALETVSGYKVDLTGQISKHFQMGGTWAYSKMGGSFSLNTAVISDNMSPDASFIAGTYHDNGKLESRSNLKLGYGFGLGGEAMFQGPDTRRAYYTVELSKAFDNFNVSGKAGTGLRSFSYMQRLTENFFAGFECAYLVSSSSTVAFGKTNRNSKIWATFFGIMRERMEATDIRSISRMFRSTQSIRCLSATFSMCVFAARKHQ